MRIIVIGAGEAGFDVARMLAHEHDVIVVDEDPDVIQEVQERLDVMAIHGNGTSAAVLAEAGVRKADMLVALTAVDEVNLIACMMADRLGVPTTVARVRSSELSEGRPVIQAKDFGIDLLIHPEESAAAEVTRLIRRASATDVLTFCDERIHLVGMRIDADSAAIGRTLQEIARQDASLTYRVMGIVRGVRTILPRGDEKLRKDDQIFILMRPNLVPKVARLMGKSDRRIDHVMVLGGTQIGARVAQQLSGEREMHIKLIEPNRATAERLAADLRNVLVINGDATDIDLLIQEGLGEMDAFVAVTQDEESNLVFCLMAKHLGVRKTVALLSKPAYIPISQSIGLDAAVNKKLAVSREVLRFLRGKHVLSVATVHGLDAEVLEIEASPGTRITRGPLKEVGVPQGVLIGAVVGKGGDVEVATGETRIAPGDRTILFALPGSIHQVEKFFGKD